MNAPLKAEPLILGDLDDFAECCEHHAWFLSEGWISLQTAVDNLQRLAERWGLLGEDGENQDFVHGLIAAPIQRVREQANGSL